MMAPSLFVSDVQDLYWTSAYSLAFYLTLTALVNLTKLDAYILSKSKDVEVRKVSSLLPAKSAREARTSVKRRSNDVSLSLSLPFTPFAVRLRSDLGGKKAKGVHGLHGSVPSQQHNQLAHGLPLALHSQVRALPRRARPPRPRLLPTQPLTPTDRSFVLLAFSHAETGRRIPRRSCCLTRTRPLSSTARS